MLQLLNRLFTSAAVVAAVATVGFGGTGAKADSFYSVQSTLDLLITDFTDAERNPLDRPTEFVVEGDAFGGQTASATGAADVDATGSGVFSFDEASAQGFLDLFVDVSGGSAPVGESIGDAFSDGFVSFANGTDQGVGVLFELSFDLQGEAGAESEFDNAFAALEVSLASDTLGQLLLLDLHSDSFGAFAAPEELWVLVPAGASETLTAFNAASGFAASVPEPGAFALLALGLGGLAVVGRRESRLG